MKIADICLYSYGAYADVGLALSDMLVDFCDSDNFGRLLGSFCVSSTLPLTADISFIVCCRVLMASASKYSSGKPYAHAYISKHVSGRSTPSSLSRSAWVMHGYSLMYVPSFLVDNKCNAFCTWNTRDTRHNTRSGRSIGTRHASPLLGSLSGGCRSVAMRVR